MKNEIRYFLLLRPWPESSHVIDSLYLNGFPWEIACWFSDRKNCEKAKEKFLDTQFYDQYLYPWFLSDNMYLHEVW